MAHKIDTYVDLLRQIRNDLRLQHPEWIEPNGQSPICDSYEARLIELLSIPAESNNDIVGLSDIPTLLVAEKSIAASFS
jgi:hypothetical protein